MDWRYWQRFGGYPEYVPVHQRLAKAKERAAKQAKRAGREPEPVQITGRVIATTFWGKSWCQNLENYSDVANRLPRGKTYARNGSVTDLAVTRGRVEAVVAGTEVYDVAIAISPIAPQKWKAIKRDCATSIGSLIDLLSGRLADDVMHRLARPGDGMFPSPREMVVQCSCPDAARICKHIAAVIYGIGNRLDTKPELLFVLRGVDQTDLVAAATKESVSQAVRGTSAHALADDDLSSIFGIDLGATAEAKASPPASRPAKKAVRAPQTRAKTSARKGKAKMPVAKKATATKPNAKDARNRARAKKTAAKKAQEKRR